MYIEHPYFYEGKYYANIDGEMIKITKEVAYAMNNFYRSSKAKKVEIKNELGKSWIRCCGRYLTVDSLQGLYYFDGASDVKAFCTPYVEDVHALDVLLRER